MKFESEQLPAVPGAALLLLASFLLRYVLTLALFDFRGALGLTPYQLDALAMVLAYGLVLAVVTQYHGMTYRNLVHPARSSVPATVFLLVPPVLLLVPLLFLANGVLNSAVVRVFPLSRWEEQAFAHMAAPNLAAIVAMCVLAPVFEEMLFRGILLRGFLAHYPKGQAIAASALLFGVAHLNIYQFVAAFLIGLLLGWLYERSRSLIPCIALHATYNSVIAASDQIFSGTDSLGDVSPLVWAAALGTAFVGTVALARILGGIGMGRRRTAT
jgi:hypothetical protein